MVVNVSRLSALRSCTVYDPNDLAVESMVIAIFICVAEPRPRATEAQIGPKTCKIHSSLESQPKFMKSGSSLSYKILVSEECTVHVF